MRPLPIYCPTYQLIMCVHMCILHIDYILQKPVIYYLLSDYNFLMHILLVLQVGTLEDDPMHHANPYLVSLFTLPLIFFSGKYTLSKKGKLGNLDQRMFFERR